MSELAEKLIEQVITEANLGAIARAKSALSQAKANYDPYGPEVEKIEDELIREIEKFFKSLAQSFRGSKSGWNSSTGSDIYKFGTVELATKFRKEVLDAFESGAFPHSMVAHTGVSDPKLKGTFWYVEVRNVWA